MRCVVFAPGEQTLFLRKVKAASGRTWDQLAHDVNKSRSAIFFYLSERCKMSIETYELFASYVPQSKVREVIDVNNDAVKCRLPSVMNEELAEFLGALAGDGHIGQRYAVCFIVSNIVDREYSLRLQRLFESLFGLEARISVHQNARMVRVYSKELQTFLVRQYRLPLGKKKGRLHIPPLSDDHFARAYIRGLFDTDGSFYERGSGRGVVNICSLDAAHLAEVAALLRFWGFHPCVSGKNLCLNRLAEVKRFFYEVRPANTKHTCRFEAFLRSRYDGSFKSAGSLHA